MCGHDPSPTKLDFEVMERLDELVRDEMLTEAQYVRIAYHMNRLHRCFCQATADGYREGYEEGSECGFREGYDVGKRDGTINNDNYKEGFQAGLDKGFKEWAALFNSLRVLRGKPAAAAKARHGKARLQAIPRLHKPI